MRALMVLGSLSLAAASPALAQDIGPQEWEALPRQLRVVADQPVPAHYELARRPRVPLMIAGGAALGGSYVVGAAMATVATAMGATDKWPAYIPVAGPFIALGMPAEEDPGFGLGALLGPAGHTVEHLVEGLVQVAGLTLLTVGSFRRDVWVKQPLALGLAPTVGGARLTLAARF